MADFDTDELAALAEIADRLLLSDYSELTSSEALEIVDLPTLEEVRRVPGKEE